MTGINPATKSLRVAAISLFWTISIGLLSVTSPCRAHPVVAPSLSLVCRTSPHPAPARQSALTPSSPAAKVNQNTNPAARSLTMPIAAGVDGCPAGWLCITRDTDTGRIAFALHRQLRSLFAQSPSPDIIAIDMPIGLTDAGPRQCDLEARRILGPRRNSIFPAPIRPALRAKTRLDADRIRRSIDAKGVSAQAFGIYAKIRQLDTLLQAHKDLRQRVREIHPEVSFRAWNNNTPMPHAKRTREGQAERRRLVTQLIPEETLTRIRAAYPNNHVATDDVHDACAALWTAQRIQTNTARSIPDPPPRDPTNLQMAIWY
jgi:predicted RNase H-like nuclease